MDETRSGKVLFALLGGGTAAVIAFALVFTTPGSTDYVYTATGDIVREYDLISMRSNGTNNTGPRERAHGLLVFGGTATLLWLGAVAYMLYIKRALASSDGKRASRTENVDSDSLMPTPLRSGSD